MYKKSKKIIAIMLVLIIMLANFSNIGIYANEVLAENTSLEKQNAKTNNANVEFSTYFASEENKAYEATKNIGEDNKVIVDISVKNAGYLKNTIIKFVNSNFELVNNVNSEYISSIDTQANTVELKQIDSEENIKIQLPIKLKKQDIASVVDFSTTSMVQMQGTYVDAKGKSNNVEKEITLKLNWTANSEAILESEVTKFVPYNINGQKGLIMQTTIKSGIKDNTLPIKQTQIEVKVPSINSVTPKDIKVSANITNGNDNLKFEENNYEVNNNNVVINIQNNEDNNIVWKEEGLDEYIVTAIYPEEVLNTINGSTDIQLDINSKIQVYNANQDVLTAKVQDVKQIEGQVGNIVDLKIENTAELSKGQIYANYISNNKKEIDFTQKLITNIGLANLINKFEITQSSDKFIANGKEFEADIYYKKIKISKQNFEKILGNEGIVEIYSANVLLGTINNTTQTNENEELILDLSEFNINNITIKTTNPVEEGKLELIVEKAIKTDLKYSKSTVETFESIQTKSNIKALSEDLVIVEQNEIEKVALVEPTVQAEIKINNKDLTTVVTNENVELRAILKTNSTYNKLFENPQIEIELPSYIKEINIKNIQLMFEDELTIEQTNYVQENNGTKKIIIKLKGIQTKYSVDEIAQGANIVITADITADNLTPTTSSQIKMKVINGNEVADAISDINFIAPVGIVTVNKLINNTDSSEIMALTDNKTQKLEVTTVSKNVTSEIQVINNYSNKINNIRILGRTLMRETTDIDTNNSLNNTFDAPMLNAIDTKGMENVTVYYSENGRATEDLNNSENQWTTDVTDFSKVKSYLIVLNNYEMNIGDSVKFSYNAQIPENLNYSETVNSLYTVYFNNIQEEQILNDKAKSRTVTLTTGEAPKLEVSLESASEENSVVREQQYVKFKATIKNTGTIDAQNVKLNITAPNGKIYTYKDSEGKIQFTEDVSLIEDLENQLVAEYKTKHTEFVTGDFMFGYEESDEPEKTIEVGTIKAEEEVIVEYEIKIESIEYYNKKTIIDYDRNGDWPTVELQNTVRVIADEMQKEQISNNYKLKIEEGQIRLSVSSERFYEYTLIKGNELTYSINVENISDEDLKNVVVKVQIPKNVDIEQMEISDLIISSDYVINYTTSIDKENNQAIFNIEEIPVGWILKCDVKTVIGDIQGDIAVIANAIAENVEMHYSNEVKNRVEKIELKIEQLTENNKYIKEKEQITYKYKISNLSTVYINNLKMLSPVPEGMKFIEARIIQNDEIIRKTFLVTDDNKVEINLNIFSGETTIIVEVIMQANILTNGETEKEVINYMTVSGNNTDELTSNSVKTTIEYDENIHKVDYGNGDGVDDDNTNTESGYKISGLAWLDKNENGQRDDGEELLSGIEVRLLNKNTNEIVKDITTGNEKITRTSSTGEYIFTNIQEGEYLVIFVYNYAKYDLTQYKKSGASETTNSDVINIEMTIDGKLTTVATTDTIKIANSNARNIDIGLCESEKSDLKLDKYISAITVTYGNTVKTYSYEDAKLAKVEIPAKELSNATVIIDYKIVVTNEGAIANYIRKVVDYIPNDMKFNSELNRDWYQSTNGDLYNSSLANTKLESGESAEMALTLTRKMTDTNTGIVNNNAEIYEVYNEEGIQDIDSTPANKVTSEDDMSAADVVISIKTGDAVVYTTLISVIICITIGISAYYIRRKILRKM